MEGPRFNGVLWEDDVWVEMKRARMSHCRERLGMGWEGVLWGVKPRQVRHPGWPVWLECGEQGQGRDWCVRSWPGSTQVGS